MNAAFWTALVWGALGLVALLFTHGKGKATLVITLVSIAGVSSLLGVAVTLGLL